MNRHRIGCTLWSLRIPDTVTALERAASMGLEAVQMMLGDEDLAPAGLDRIREALDRLAFADVSGCIAFRGEDYSSIDAIRATGGFVPADPFPERLDRCRRHGRAFAELGIRTVTTHAGFLPEPGDPGGRDTLGRLAEAAGALAEADLAVGLETGQESSEVLLAVLDALAMPRLGVNYDPANFVLYGTDEPLPAARRLAGRVISVHAKDARPSNDPGREWGEEAPLGRGAVDFAAVVEALEAGGFDGPLLIEREGGTDRAGDIAAGRDFLAALMGG